MRPGEVILSVNGRPAGLAADVSREVQRLEPGEEATLEVERRSKVEHPVVTTRPYDPRLTLLGGCLLESLDGIADAWPWRGGWIDLELAVQSPGPGHSSGADRGVHVIRAPADGALQLSDGDVVTAIGGREPQSVAHALRILRSYQPGEHVAIAVLRDHKPLKLGSSMPARPAFDGRTPPRPPRAPAAPPAPPAPAVPALPPWASAA